MNGERYYSYLLITFVGGIFISLLFYNIDKKRFVDQEGVENINPSRIICMSPAIAEIVFELNLGDKVVGVSEYTTYPAEVYEKECVGEYLNPNLEKILSLRPELIMIQGKHDRLTSFCKSNSIPYFSVDFTGIDSILKNIEVIGARLNKKRESEILVSKIKRSMDEIDQRIKDLKKPYVFISLWRKPGSLSNLFTCGKGSFMDELVQKAGGRNIFSDVDKNYFGVSLESILKKCPEVIIETVSGMNISEEERQKYISDWNDLSSIPAVRLNRVYVLTENYLQIPGPRIHEAIKCIAKTLHPAAF